MLRQNYGNSRRDFNTLLAESSSPIMTGEQLAPLLEQLGCPKDKSLEMAGQLDKRARQLMEQQGRSYDETLTHLINLMKQGWAAKERGL
jgi:hypothetical protein